MNNRIIISALVVFLMSVFINPISYAQEDVQALKQQVKELQQRINGLESVQQKKASPSHHNNHSSHRGWDPFQEMDRIQEEMNRLFHDSYSRNVGYKKSNINSVFHPEIDIAEKKNEYIFKLDLPGMEKSDIKIETEAHYLEISGKKDTELIAEDETNHYYRKERSFGQFSRTIPLPEDADSKKIDAQYKDGVLTVKVGKIKGIEKKSFKRRIPIQEG